MPKFSRGTAGMFCWTKRQRAQAKVARRALRKDKYPVSVDLFDVRDELRVLEEDTVISFECLLDSIEHFS